jgi:fatty acid-binding protein DegV
MIKVVTDSSCDLPLEVLKELGIVVVPLIEYLGVLHTRRPDDAQAVADRLRGDVEFQGQILVGETGVVLSSHAGPGVVGVVGVEKS